MTSVLDRLEAKGYARRTTTTLDRRKVLVAATELRRGREQAVFGDLVTRVVALVRAEDQRDLLLLLGFLRRLRMLIASAADGVSSDQSGGTGR